MEAAEYGEAGVGAGDTTKKMRRALPARPQKNISRAASAPRSPLAVVRRRRRAAASMDSKKKITSNPVVDEKSPRPLQAITEHPAKTGGVADLVGLEAAPPAITERAQAPATTPDGGRGEVQAPVAGVAEKNRVGAVGAASLGRVKKKRARAVEAHPRDSWAEATIS
jgi:hypothetical protein